MALASMEIEWKASPILHPMHSRRSSIRPAVAEKSCFGLVDRGTSGVVGPKA